MTHRSTMKIDAAIVKNVIYGNCIWVASPPIVAKVPAASDILMGTPNI